MGRDWWTRALAGFWDWAPMLVALEPGAMAYAEVLREKDTATDADLVPRRNRAGVAFRSRFWAAELEK